MRDSQTYKILDAKATTGIGTNIFVKDYRNAILSIATSGSANFTAKIVGSTQSTDFGADAAPDFSAAQSVTNMWDYIQVIKYDDGTAVNGSTGVTSAGTDIYKIYEININGLEWININITAISAGAITAKVLLLDNQ